MCAPFDDGGAGDEGDLSLLLELGQGNSTAAAHRGLHLTEGLCEVVLELTSVGDVAVDTFFELQSFAATAVVALPVLSAVRAFAPVFLDDVVADLELSRGRLVEASEVATHHEEVGTHSDSQRHVVVVYQTTVATDGDIDTRLLEVLVTSLSYIDDRSSLTTTDPLLLTSDTDGATTDTDLDEVCTSLSEVAEALFVDDVASTDEDLVAVLLADPAEGVVLPLRVAVGGVDTEDVCTSFDEGGDRSSFVALLESSTGLSLCAS